VPNVHDLGTYFQELAFGFDCEMELSYSESIGECARQNCWKMCETEDCFVPNVGNDCGNCIPEFDLDSACKMEPGCSQALVQCADLQTGCELLHGNAAVANVVAGFVAHDVCHETDIDCLDYLKNAK